MFDKGYDAQIRLIIHCIPEIAKQDCFALKGGSAINLFLQDMPRLSVDIDLTYLPLNSRDEALREINDSLIEVKDAVISRIKNTSVQAIRHNNIVCKLLVSTSEATVKIEPNLITRGSVYPPESRDLCRSAQDRFESFASMATLSVPDLYAGKLCAALDRQHPRDLFDVKLMLDTTGITPEIRRAFVVYLVSHNRPISELLDPRMLDISEPYQKQFMGMTRMEVSVDELQSVQRNLAASLVKELDAQEKNFLISLKEGKPNWNLLGIDHLAQFPAIKWKLMNIEKMKPEAHEAALEKLKRILDR